MDRQFAWIQAKIKTSMLTVDPVPSLKSEVLQLIIDGCDRQIINHVLIVELIHFLYSTRDYDFKQELGETLELMILWTSRFHPECPEPWYSGPPFDGTTRAKDAEIVAKAEAWLESIKYSSIR
jgi:hypothetical protein